MKAPSATLRQTLHLIRISQGLWCLEDIVLFLSFCMNAVPCLMVTARQYPNMPP